VHGSSCACCYLYGYLYISAGASLSASSHFHGDLSDHPCFEYLARIGIFCICSSGNVLQYAMHPPGLSPRSIESGRQIRHLLADRAVFGATLRITAYCVLFSGRRGRAYHVMLSTSSTAVAVRLHDGATYRVK